MVHGRAALLVSVSPLAVRCRWLEWTASSIGADFITACGETIDARGWGDLPSTAKGGLRIGDTYTAFSNAIIPLAAKENEARTISVFLAY